MGRWNFAIGGLFSASLLLSGCSVFNDKADSEIKVVDRQQAAQARLTLGLAYLERGDFNLAQRNFMRAAQYTPDNYRVHLALALYEQGLGEFDNARVRYERALQLAPQDGEVLNNYGVFLCHIGEYAQAHQLFELAHNGINYDMIVASLENSGYCYIKQGLYPQAQQFLSRALRYEPVRQKNLLAMAEHYLAAGHNNHVAALLSIYQQSSPITAESLWLQIRFAALNNDLASVEHYGRMLAENFSHSEQYKRFLAHEY